MARFNFDVYHKTPTAGSTPQASEAQPGNAALTGDVDKAHFTAEEAAAYMNLSMEAFRVLAADPELQPVRVNGVYYYRVAAVQRFLVRMESSGD